MPPHQLGTATAILNFFRSLGGAFLVAGFGAILLASAASHAGPASVQTLILEGTKAGIDFGHVFSGVFYAAAAANFCALLAMMAMEELPLRGRHVTVSCSVGTLACAPTDQRPQIGKRLERGVRMRRRPPRGPR